MATKLTVNTPSISTFSTLKPNRSERPLLLGIVGDSGSGKSTLISGLEALFGAENVTEICLDDYHSYDRATRARLGLTALNPAANNLNLMTGQLRCLRAGLPICKPVYDHSTGTFAPSEWVMPKRFVIVHGLLTLHTPELAELFDLSVYLNPETELRLAWKMRRDTQKRGYTLAQVQQQIEERRPDAAAFIQPQQAYADLIVSFCRPGRAASEEELDAHLFCRPDGNGPQLQAWANPPLTYDYQSDGHHLLIPHTFELAQLQEYNGIANRQLGLYQSSGGQCKQSLSLALTQLLIAGCLLHLNKPTLVAA